MQIKAIGVVISTFETLPDSLKESGDLEYAADAVLFLVEAPERPILPPARAVDLVVAKHRHGDTGTIALIFRPDLGTLREEEWQ